MTFYDDHPGLIGKHWHKQSVDFTVTPPVKKTVRLYTEKVVSETQIDKEKVKEAMEFCSNVIKEEGANYALKRIDFEKFAKELGL